MDEHVIQEGAAEEPAPAVAPAPGTEALKAQCAELNDRYTRLYADFENFKRRTAKERQDLIKYGPEQLSYELLAVIDTLELGLQHAAGEPANGLRQGIEMTLKEFLRVLEKFGLKRVEAVGRRFDPKFHEAMSQVERDDLDDGTVVDEFRKGYTFHDKLIRASLVSVSKKPAVSNDDGIRIHIQKEEA